jgi:hypothetical protein
VSCEGECRGRGTFEADVEHCGACGNRCSAGPCERPICVDGECGVEPNPALIGTPCDPGDPCVESAVCGADGLCAGSPMNCGNCRQCLGGQCFNRPNGIACLGGTFRCCDGHCIQACGVGLECCGGACHEPCPFGAVRGEDCACACPPELPNLCNPGTFDAYCTDFATDETNCGGCGTTCNAFATCFDGACRCCQGGSISCGAFSTDTICCDYPLSAVQCCNAPCDHPQLDCVMFCLDCGLDLDCDFNAACPAGYGAPFTNGAGGPIPNACAG